MSSNKNEDTHKSQMVPKDLQSSVVKSDTPAKSSSVSKSDNLLDDLEALMQTSASSSKVIHSFDKFPDFQPKDKTNVNANVKSAIQPAFSPHKEDQVSNHSPSNIKTTVVDNTPHQVQAQTLSSIPLSLKNVQSLTQPPARDTLPYPQVGASSSKMAQAPVRNVMQMQPVSFQAQANLQQAVVPSKISPIGNAPLVMYVPQHNLNQLTNTNFFAPDNTNMYPAHGEFSNLYQNSPGYTWQQYKTFGGDGALLHTPKSQSMIGFSSKRFMQYPSSMHADVERPTAVMSKFNKLEESTLSAGGGGAAASYSLSKSSNDVESSNKDKAMDASKKSDTLVSSKNGKTQNGM